MMPIAIAEVRRLGRRWPGAFALLGLGLMRVVLRGGAGFALRGHRLTAGLARVTSPCLDYYNLSVDDGSHILESRRWRTMGGR